MPLRRSSDPVFLQHIWNAIESTRNSENVTSFQCILSSIHTTCDPKCSPAKLHRELTNAANDGCIRIAGDQYSLVPGFECIQKDRSDWYCFECHAPGVVIPCSTCFRVYHAECLSTAAESNWSCRLPVEDPTVGSKAEVDTETPPKHPCPVCKRLQRASTTTENTISIGDLHKVFLEAYDSVHNRVNWKTLQKVGYLYEPLRNEYLVYRQINTRMIGERLRAEPRSNDGYPNRTTFLIDLDNLVHNTAVFYGTKHAISNMARQIRSHLRRAMRESTYCIDCYVRPSTLSPVARLTAACRKPHRLLWFQHNGWSFRPCKMLYESAEGYEVVCFGGRHEREFVPLARAFDITTFTAPDLGLRMTPSLKKALDEAEEYKANQSAYDRNLPPSSSNTRVQHLGTSRLSLLTADAIGNTCSVGRKRKAGPKYASAFGSTDTESMASTFSKRAKGRISSNNGVHVHSKRKTMAKTEREDNSSVVSKYTERHSFTTTNSDSDTDDNNSCSPHWRQKSVSSNLESVTNCSTSRTAQRRLSNPDLEFPSSMSHKHPGISASPGSSISSLPSSTSKTSSFVSRKPVIRIKALPLPPDGNQSSSFSLLSDAPDLARRQKPKTATPSPSSALSGPPSSLATIPAIASVDELSRDSSLSSASSHPDRFSSSKACRSNDKPFLTNHMRPQKIRNPTSSATLPPAPPPGASNAVTGTKAQTIAPCLGRRFPYSHSPSDSDGDDSDSSSSSSSLSDSSSTSTVLSSTSVSSDSTIPSLHTRRVSASTKLTTAATATATAFASNHRHRQNSDKYRPVTPSEELSSKVSKVMACAGSVNESSKPDCTSGSVLRSKQQTSLDHSKPPTWDTWKLAKHENQSHTSPVAPESVIKLSKGLKSSVSVTQLSTNEPSTVINASSGASSMRPTPPFSSSSSSSWHSSVSPAALSTTSGLGSSLSDPKSVDASPADGVALLLGCASFGNQASVQTITTATESAIYKSAEEHLHRFYNERLALLTAERDQAREEVVQRDAMLAKLRTDHEAEIRRVKQLTWCQICLSQAYYHCCPGTAYCSEACQLRHWTEQHNRDCRRQASESHQQQQQRAP